MSTKTNFKRVALVAVASLGLGVLTSVAPANAAFASATLVATNGTTGVCTSGTAADAANARYVSVGGVQAITFQATATSEVSITGPAVFASGGVDGTVASDGLSLTTAAAATVIQVRFTGTGGVQVSFDDSTEATETFYFIVQPSCASGYAAGSSFAALAAASDETGITTNVDAAGSAAIAYNATAQVTYLNINARTAYTAGAASASSVNIATVTGGCKINFTHGTTAFSSGKTTDVVTGAGADQDSIVIIGDNTPRTCTVTSTLDGVVIATKTVNMYGDLATLTISPADSKKYLAYNQAGSSSAAGTLNKDAIVYLAKDSAGNIINHSAAPTMSSQTGSMVGVTAADGTASYAAAVATGYATLDVNTTGSLTAGPGTFVIKATRQSDGVSVSSAPFSVENNKSRYTYTASFDKASYVSGEIMTLTITAKDSAGRMAYDGETIGTNTIAVGGTTTLTTIATTDTFLNGVKTYKFAAGSTASGYGWSVDITSGSSQSAITGTVNITAPAGGVSNADVLKAIVSLIASINKQIAALQKALLKR
jgi:hypothetical protein